MSHSLIENTLTSLSKRIPSFTSKPTSSAQESLESKHDSAFHASSQPAHKILSLSRSKSFPKQEHHLQAPATTPSPSLNFLNAPLGYLKSLTVAGSKLVKGPKASASRTKTALSVIEKIYQDDHSSDRLLLKRSLTVDEYHDLLRQISQRPSLKGYFEDKIR